MAGKEKKTGGKDNFPELEYLWEDRMRRLGLPLSFTRYAISNDRLFVYTGFLNTRSEEILLYRVRDMSVSISLGQRIFGVGTIIVDSADKTAPVLAIRNIKRPYMVKELLHQKVEEAKKGRSVRPMEMVGGDFNFDGGGGTE